MDWPWQRPKFLLLDPCGRGLKALGKKTVSSFVVAPHLPGILPLPLRKCVLVFFFIRTADFRALRNGARPGFSTFFPAKWKTTWLQFNAEASSSPQVAGSPSRAQSNGAPCAIQLQRMLEDRIKNGGHLGDIPWFHYVTMFILGVFRDEHSMIFMGLMQQIK